MTTCAQNGLFGDVTIYRHGKEYQRCASEEEAQKYLYTFNRSDQREKERKQEIAEAYAPYAHLTMRELLNVTLSPELLDRVYLGAIYHHAATCGKFVGDERTAFQEVLNRHDDYENKVLSAVFAGTKLKFNKGCRR